MTSMNPLLLGDLDALLLVEPPLTPSTEEIPCGEDFD
jgi:hypothetical protein